MRMWHKDLISVLPNKQLCGQWKELFMIKGSIDKKGTPNHLLVNKVLDYSVGEFTLYANMVYNEMKNRGYKPNDVKFQELVKFEDYKKFSPSKQINDIYENWHDKTYLKICYYNLLEKYMCGGITYIQWQIISDKYKKLIDNA